MTKREFFNCLDKNLKKIGIIMQKEYCSIKQNIDFNPKFNINVSEFYTINLKFVKGLSGERKFYLFDLSKKGVLEIISYLIFDLIYQIQLNFKKEDRIIKISYDNYIEIIDNKIFE